MDDEVVMVSVICKAYNHGQYIKDALDGFVSQITNFRYEVIVHDDASTDDTADIIRQYEELYPSIIKAIYQHENQYSQGILTNIKYINPLINGKYVALCEGDDFWTDPYKLQKQFDAMEKHSEIDLCAHAALVMDAETTMKISIQEPSKSLCIFSPREVMKGGGAFVATASLFMRSEIWHNPMPFREKLILDYTIQVQGSLRGGMLYLPDTMSVYRANVPTSWTRTQAQSIEKKISHRNRILVMLRQLNKDTKNKYFLTILGLYIKALAKKCALLLIYKLGIK